MYLFVDGVTRHGEAYVYNRCGGLTIGKSRWKIVQLFVFYIIHTMQPNEQIIQYKTLPEMQDSHLHHQTLDTPLFTLNGQTHWAKCVKCYDADTIHIVVRFNDTYVRFRCRLQGIDTAELRSKDADEKKHARIARDWLTELILNKLIVVRCGTFDKYGRVLVNVFVPPVSSSLHAVGGTSLQNENDTKQQNKNKEMNTDALVSVNQQLIDEGYAYAYAGGRRRLFKQWFK